MCASTAQKDGKFRNFSVDVQYCYQGIPAGRATLVEAMIALKVW
jgi:hypothetical protein